MIIPSSTHHYAVGGGMKCLSAKSSAGGSGVNSVAVKSNTTEDIRDFSLDVKKNITCLHTAPVVSTRCTQAPTFIFDSKHVNF